MAISRIFIYLQLLLSNPLKPDPMRGKKFNGPSHIADVLLLEDDFIVQTARLQYFKINYYKHTLLRPGLKETREELRESIRNSMFNFCSPAAILNENSFYLELLAN